MLGPDWAYAVMAYIVMAYSTGSGLGRGLPRCTAYLPPRLRRTESNLETQKLKRSFRARRYIYTYARLTNYYGMTADLV